MLGEGTTCVVCDKILSDGERGVEGDYSGTVDLPRICRGCWKCPKCANDGQVDEFCIDEGYASCSRCGLGFTIKELERRLVKKANRIKW